MCDLCTHVTTIVSPGVVRSYDAGYGSDLNADGFVEMDALIMDGSNLKAGAVAGIRYALCAHLLVRSRERR